MDFKLEDQTNNNDINKMKNEELTASNCAIVENDNATAVKNDFESAEPSYEESVIDNLHNIDTTKNATSNVYNNDDNVENSSNNNNSNNVNNNNDSNSTNNSKQGAVMEPEQFRKVFIGGLSYKTDDETLKSYFSKYGELVDYVVMKDSQTGRSRGFGFVTYAESYMVDELMKNRPHVIDGRQVEPKRATPREDSGKAEVQMTVKKLFIGGLRDTVNEDDLKSYFNQYGNVLEAVIMKEKDNNKSRGFGFVTFDDYDPVDKIILEKHHTINGINVHTQKALPKDFDKNQNKTSVPTNPKSYNNNNHNNNFNNYHHNNGNMGHQYNQSTHHNPNMPNLNTLAQMAASFFAAASANKNLPKSSTASNTMGGLSQNNSNGHRASYENFAYNTSSTTNNTSNNNHNKSMNNNNLNNPMNNMNYLMNQMMSQRGSLNMGSAPNNMNNKMSNHMSNNGPGPVRGGHGRFSTRSGPYNAPNATTNYSSGSNLRGRSRGGNRNMGNRFNNNSNNNNNQIN